MALPQILEGTWEEIKQRDAELAGRFLRVIVEPANDTVAAANGNSSLDLQLEAERIARIKSMRGKYAHVGVSVEDLHRERAAEVAREESAHQSTKD